MSRERGAGFFSTSFWQPQGQRVAGTGLEGYYIDMRVKARSPDWPPESVSPLEVGPYVELAQWGLGCFEHFVAGGDERWLAAAVACGEHLIEHQLRDNPFQGGFPHNHPFPHTYRLEPPWLSAMVQGEAASLFFRLGSRTGDERFTAAGQRSLAPLAKPGLRAELGDGWFLQEYPTDPPSHVLNGGIYALWAYRDAALALEDDGAQREFEAGVDMLAANLWRWDTGSWSLYDLFPHALAPVASSAYHELHIAQLRATNSVAPRPALAEMAERWESYSGSRAKRVGAFARKAVFRLAVPRNRLLAHRMPWEQATAGKLP